MAPEVPDLTQRPPRSPRVRLGGFVLLPRMLDKGRAELGGKNGDYHYNCPLDQRFLEFIGVAADSLKAQLAAGKGDREILDWIRENSVSKPTDLEIIAWSRMQEQRVPGDVESRNFFNELHEGADPLREDIQTWFDLLDLDDFATFGGRL